MNNYGPVLTSDGTPPGTSNVFICIEYEQLGNKYTLWRIGYFDVTDDMVIKWHPLPPLSEDTAA